MTPLIDVRSLRIERAASGAPPLLHDVSFRLDAARALAIVGASGSGKTLSMLSVMRLLPASLVATGSSVRLVGGIEAATIAPEALPAWRAATFGVVPATPAAALDPLRTIAAQFAATTALAPAVTADLASLLQLTGFERPERIAPRYPHQLSGGELQRVALALALARRPAALIIDEPTSALDAIGRQEVIALLARIRTTTDAAILLVTHDLDVATAVADTAVVMHEGRTVEEAPPGALWRAGTHAATRALVAAWPQLPEASPAPPTEESPPRTVLLSARALGVTHRAAGRSPVAALADVTLDVHQHERIALVGRSGSGKSTLARCLVGLQRPTTGSVALRGAPLPSPPARAWRRDIQWLMQDAGRSIDPRLTVFDAIAEARRAHRLHDAGGEHARVHAVLREVGLDAEHASRFPHELSSGQRQRVALARALILDPQCLVLDEPVTALDPVTAARITGLLDTIRAQRTLALLFITHDLARVPQLADRVVVMHEGRVVEDGPAIRVLTRPAHPVTTALRDATRRAAALLSPAHHPPGEDEPRG